MIILRGTSETVGDAARFEEAFNDSELDEFWERHFFLEENGWKAETIHIPKVDKNRYYESILERLGL